MVVYRLARKKYIRNLSGEGARRYGGRWNHKGVPALYTSEHCSLALLEYLVHTQKDLMPPDIYYLQLSVPDDIEVSTFKKKDLPGNWKQFPAPSNLADLGSNWSAEMKTAVLKVPSVIVPNEWNLLLNPLHPQFKLCKIKSVSAFEIDFRIETALKR